MQPNHSDLFRSRRVLTTMSKDNELDWIRDWVLFHVSNHGCDAVLLYDNGSIKYDTTEVRQAILSVPGIEVAVVVDWPFPYGPGGGPGGKWDSDFSQYAVLEHARLRFLAHADGVINADVDELVMTTDGRSVFDLARNSRTGYLQYPGVMIENVREAGPPGRRRHAHFVYQSSPPRPATRKWTITPARCPDRSQWRVHEVTGMHPDQEASARVEHRHFAGINTGWKLAVTEPASQPGLAHVVDQDAVRLMRCIAVEM